MKTYYILIPVFAVLAVMQACSSKSKENGTSTAATADSVANAQKSADDAMAKSEEKNRAERKKKTEERKAAETYEVSGLTVYNRAEVKPSYKGGQDALNKYLKANLKYPAGTQWQGTLVVDFVIGKDGMVNYADVTEDVDSVSDQVCREEAIRVIKAMPAWTPGKHHGTSVATSYSLPVTFQQL